MSDTVNLLDFAKSPLEMRRRCGMPIVLQNKENPNQLITVRSYCNSWKCERCRPIIQKRWTEHLSTLFMLEEALFVLEIERDKWDTLSKRICRSKGSFVTILRTNGQLTVITNRPEGKRIHIASVLTVLNKAFGDVSSSSKRPVYTSRAWSFKRKDLPKGKWERVQKLLITFEEAQQVITIFNLPVNYFWTNRAFGFGFTIPEDWTEEQKSKLFNALTIYTAPV